MTTAARATLDRELSEKDWQANVIAYAQLRGWLTYHPFDSRRSTHGYPDVTLAREGRVVFAELKSATGRLRPQQRVWLDVLATAAETYLWRPGDWLEVERILA